MIIRFTKENWNRFFTKNKKSTFRIHPKEIGHYDVYGGSYYHPVKFGELDIVQIEKKKFAELTEQDAKDDGFDSLQELKDELLRLNEAIKKNTVLYKHWVKNVKEERKV